MNLRNWNREHTKGLLIGILSPIVFIPLVIFILSWAQDYYFSQLWFKFMNNHLVRSKYLSIAVISNLIWFYRSLNKENYNFSMGIILGSLCYLPYIIYVNFVIA